jgi:hypothetical protein
LGQLGLLQPRPHAAGDLAINFLNRRDQASRAATAPPAEFETGASRSPAMPSAT